MNRTLVVFWFCEVLFWKKWTLPSSFSSLTSVNFWWLGVLHSWAIWIFNLGNSTSTTFSGTLKLSTKKFVDLRFWRMVYCVPLVLRAGHAQFKILREYYFYYYYYFFFLQIRISFSIDFWFNMFCRNHKNMANSKLICQRKENREIINCMWPALRTTVTTLLHWSFQKSVTGTKARGTCS